MCKSSIILPATGTSSCRQLVCSITWLGRDSISNMWQGKMPKISLIGEVLHGLAGLTRWLVFRYYFMSRVISRNIVDLIKRVFSLLLKWKRTQLIHVGLGINSFISCFIWAWCKPFSGKLKTWWQIDKLNKCFVQVLQSRVNFFGSEDISNSKILLKYRKSAEAVMCNLLPDSQTGTESKTNSNISYLLSQLTFSCVNFQVSIFLTLSL